MRKGNLVSCLLLAYVCVCICVNLVREATCRWQQAVVTGQAVIRGTTSRDRGATAAGG